MRLSLLFAALAVLPAVFAAGCQKATYKLTLTTLFSKDNFPLAPANAHLSPLTSFSHNRRFSAFVLYGYATTGVKNVAETGNNAQLKRELNHPLVKDIATTNNLIFARGSFVVMLDVDCNNPFISAITMIAPSPDWFVAISSLDMRKKSGRFARMRSGQLRVYDAGTDSGRTLSAANSVTKPVENIAPLVGAPFNGKPAATFKLERVSRGSSWFRGTSLQLEMSLGLDHSNGLCRIPPCVGMRTQPCPDQV